ncbi:MAG TPA: alpha/beta hydrolase-fold protein [Bryobacteraceae bacterium]|jgi:predicted alpha/beta superfamily hydrolase
MSPSRFLAEPRKFVVYLPPDYHRAKRRYPVLYLHDGQNLFDSATAFQGNDWGLGVLADELIRRTQIAPLIIVGVYNSGEKRLAEYTHVRDRAGRGGRASGYGRFLVEDLKPLIDKQYRTLPEAANTGLGGSSLGGLVTLYLGLKYTGVFGRLIVMSPSVWWANRAILKRVWGLRRKSDQKIWLDVGTAEDRNPQPIVDNVMQLRDALMTKGWQLGKDLAFRCEEGAGHSEKFWGRRMRDALPFLFPPG